MSNHSGFYSYYSQFPESLFLPSDDHVKEYNTMVIRGYDYLATKNICIAGLARNTEDNVKHMIPKLERLGGLSKSCSVVIVENDSTDNTRPLLQQWSSVSVHDVHVLSADVGMPKLGSGKNVERTIYLAACRNEYLRHIRNFLPTTDYVCVVDIDLNGGFSFDGIAHSFGLIEAKLHDAVFANSILFKNGESLYFDSWAWRDPYHKEPHLDYEINTRVFRRGEKPVDVWSAFGGFGIYGLDSLSNLWYHGHDDIEHASINFGLVEQGQNLCMNPSMITLYSKTQYSL